MKELAKRFIDKECVISSFDGNHQYEGIIKEVTDGAILVEKDGMKDDIDDEELKVATSGEIISAVLHNDLNFLPFLNSDKVMERF